MIEAAASHFHAQPAADPTPTLSVRCISAHAINRLQQPHATNCRQSPHAGMCTWPPWPPAIHGWMWDYLQCTMKSFGAGRAQRKTRRSSDRCRDIQALSKIVGWARSLQGLPCLAQLSVGLSVLVYLPVCLPVLLHVCLSVFIPLRPTGLHSYRYQFYYW